MGRLFEHPVTIIALIVIVILLFGSKRLPDLASGIGQSLRIFKKEIRDLSDDDKAATTQQTTAPTAPPAATAAAPAAPPAPVVPATPPVPPAPAAPVDPAPPAAPVAGTTAEHDPHSTRP